MALDCECKTSSGTRVTVLLPRTLYISHPDVFRHRVVTAEQQTHRLGIAGGSK